jgi:hypothetical protein
MPSLKQGQTTTKEDLNSYYYIGGSLSDPFWVSYTILDSTTGTDELIGMPDRNPIKFGIGSFYAPWTLPDDEPIGLHKITWKFKESATSEIKSETEEFQVIPPCATMQQDFPDFIQYLINQLRIRLRDINPDRDYSIGGEEKITLDVDGKEVTLTIEELYNIIKED